MTEQPKRPALLTVKEADEEYHIDRSTLFRWIKAGRIKPVKKSGDQRTYVRRSALEAELAKPAEGRGKRGEWREEDQDCRTSAVTEE